MNKIELSNKGVRYSGEFLTDEIIQFNDCKFYERRVRRKDIVKYSKNIIDLIKVGDIIHTKDVLNEDIVCIWSNEYLEVIKEDIKNGIKLVSIVTFEQFKDVEYKV